MDIWQVSLPKPVLGLSQESEKSDRNRWGSVKTSKKAPWMWGEAQQTAFDVLKHAVTSQPVLMFADDACPFHIKADSSDFATGMVLSQQSAADKRWHPVAFLSKSLNVVEWNYKIHDKEMLAIIHVLAEWRHFLERA
jgi:hypothetical protein